MVYKPRWIQTEPKAGDKVAVYCGTRNLYEDMEVAAKSLVANNPWIDRVYFLIEDDEFPTELPDIIKVVNISKQNVIKPSSPNFKNPWTYMVMVRIMLHRIFPYLDKILSLDVDTLVLSGLRELWDLDLSDCYAAMVREVVREDEAVDKYFNFGVCFQNLEKLRDGKGDEIIESLNTKKWGFPEQDAFNYLCEHHIHELPGNYNISDFTTMGHGPNKIRHYAAEKKYLHDMPAYQYYRQMSWAQAIRGKYN